MNAADFLTSLFVAPVVVTVLKENPNSQQAITREATRTDDPRVVGAPHALGEALDDDWVERPDVNGKMGWEPCGVPESMRWWARSTFEDLPK